MIPSLQGYYSTARLEPLQRMLQLSTMHEWHSYVTMALGMHITQSPKRFDDQHAYCKFEYHVLCTLGLVFINRDGRHLLCRFQTESRTDIIWKRNA
ncbi:hypothetical protein KC321_g78 [Hortaea werneckii]|nr:hypothetical protein KC321_g78 [Hortaea werneckii]